MTEPLLLHPVIRFKIIPCCRKAVLSLALVGFFSAVQAQAVRWPNPEVEQLYKSAQASLAAGAYKQAIASYQQAIALVPDQMILQRDLARAYLLSGNPVKAQQVITPIIKDEKGDAVSYVTAASIQTALQEEKKARKMLERGIERFPSSGFLYNALGKHYEEGGDMTSALQQWVAGIAAEPAYHVNYYDAARAYMRTNKPVWAIIYGEIFVNLERLTPRSGETRKLLLSAYKRFYATPDMTTGRQKAKESADPDFEETVTRTLLKLAPVVADGVSTENLTMLRTRFAMDWQAAPASKYPFSLFWMHDELLRAGQFDAYNQWLFGRAENAAQYEAWMKFHPEAIAAYDAYYRLHPLQPTASDAYNHNISGRIFLKTDNQRKR